MNDAERGAAEEAWIYDNQDLVRTSLNEQRNYVQQEVRELVYTYWKENKEAELPNVEEILL